MSLAGTDSYFREFARRAQARKRSAKGWNANIRAAAVDIEELPGGVEYWVVENAMAADMRILREQLMSRTEAEGRFKHLAEGLTYFLRRFEHSHNGYVAFPKRTAPQVRREMGGILDYIPVHGGVTWAHKDETAMVYGFDTQHHNSQHFPVREIPWIKWQCRVLHEGLVMAAKIEKAYLNAKSEQAKAEILQPLVDLVPEENLSTAAMLRLMIGEL